MDQKHTFPESLTATLQVFAAPSHARMSYVKEFEGLRGLLAVWVLLGHWATTIATDLRPLARGLYNQSAVTVFILLSGFAVAAMVHARAEPFRLYIARRFLRIFPAYLLFLALSVLMAPYAYDIWLAAPAGSMRTVRLGIAENTMQNFTWHLLAHVTGLHGMVPPKILPSTDTAFLGQAWSISLEWQFYLIAPLLIGILCGPVKPRRMLGFVTVAALLAGLSRFMPEGFIGGSLHVFVIGIGSFHLLRLWSAGGADLRWIALDRMLPVLSAVILLGLGVQGIAYLIWVGVLACVMQRMRGPEQSNWLARLLLRPSLQGLGKMAYSVYLSHMLVLMVGLKLLLPLQNTNPSAHAVALLAFTLIGTLLMSFLSYRLVERPLHQLGRSLSLRKASFIRKF